TRLIHDPEDQSTPSSDGVSDIHTDKKGRVWLAVSSGGLNRFEDGKIFHHIESPLDAAISSIAEAGDGTLWLGTADGMLIELDPAPREASRRSPVPRRSGGLKSPVTAVLVDSKGLVWSGTQGEGVHVFDPGGGAGAASFSYEAGTLSDSSVTAIHE